MHKFLKRLIKRHQKSTSLISCLGSGIKGLITITSLSAIGYFSGNALVTAPFATSCITVFTNPDETYAQPINIIGGYFIAAIIGIIIIPLFPHEWWILGITFSLTITTMAYFRVTHPPAGGIPFVIYFYHDNAGFDFFIFPIMAGCLIITIMALILNRLPNSKEYPKK